MDNILADRYGINSSTELAIRNGCRAVADAVDERDPRVAVIEVLREEHRNVGKLLDVLERQVVIFEAAERPDFGIIEGIADYFLSYPDLYHHPKEDLVFRRLCERDPAAGERVGDLQAEHEELAARTREFAAGVQDVLDEAQVPRESFGNWARGFITLQRKHMNMEESVFFPAALAALTEEDWAAVDARIKDQDDPLFGRDIGDRYRLLKDDILRWERDESKSG